ncbi:MAG TPA: ATP-binding protein [Kouleothrix sp.]|uniref:ATP-binding protein n=1 Tax=Kouleothrix sp. TaxID=2779161 RepID=UPI002B9A0DFB|nr:ATP-binding protein [Kouleothrix sp.]HRC74236.1 ATP-binding protein [Kouleothrix sp.]
MNGKSVRQTIKRTEQPNADEAMRRAQVLTNILHVSTHLISLLDPNELILTLVERIVEVIPDIQAGMLWLPDQQGALQIRSHYGLAPPPAPALLARLRLRPGDGLVGALWQRGDAQIFESRSQYLEQAGRVSQRAHDDMRQLLAHIPRDATIVLLPLRIGKQIIGVLELLQIGTPSLHPPDLEVLQMFGNLAAGAINNAQLHAKMQAHQHRLEALGAIGTVVSMAADLDELLSNALDVILRVLETSAGMLLLHDLSTAELTSTVQRGLPRRFVALHDRIGVAHSPYEETVRYGQAIARPLIAEDGEELLIEAGFGSCVYLPLLAGGTVVGVINVYGDDLLRERVDVPALMTMGSQLGLAIANVRLYQDTRTERLKLAAVINSIAEGVVLCNGDGRLVLANQSAMELLSIERLPVEQSINEMPDFYAIRDLDGNPLPVERLPLARALSGEVFHDHRVLSRGASGQDTVLSFSGAPVYDDENNVDGAVTIFRDITTSQKLERAKDDFLAVAAHELRSPLAAVRGYTDLLVRREQRRGDEDSPELRGLTVLAQQVTHMLRMVDNILDVSRIDAGQVSLQVQPVNLVALAQQVIEQQRPLAGERQLELDSDGAELNVSCDSLRIRQVLTNLVGNAIRYSPNGTRIGVRLYTCAANAIAARHPAYAALAGADTHSMHAMVIVEDQGAGISEEQLGRLFRRYARGSERRGEGLGLGLYLSREFVARHGGQIWAESREGQGSAFFFTLPLEAEQQLGLNEQA